MVLVVFHAGLVNRSSLKMSEKEILAKRKLIDNSSEEEFIQVGQKCKGWQMLCMDSCH